MSPIVVIFITIFIDLLGFGFVLPLSPYYTQHFGGTATEVGLLGASYSLMQFLFAPFWGKMSDRFGRRPIILMSILGAGISFVMFAAANSLTMLFVTRIFQGVFGANISAAQAYIADITPKDARAKSMGIIGAAFGLGFIFGPAIGAKLSDLGPTVGTYFGYGGEGVFGMGFPGLVAGALCLVNFTLAFFILPETLKKENRNKKKNTSRLAGMFKVYRNRRVNWLIFIFFLATFAMANMEATLALFSEFRLGYHIRETGHLFAFIGIVIAFTQGYLIRKILPRFGERKILLWGPVIAGIALAATSLVTTSPQIMFTMALLALGSGLSNPAILGGISQLTDADEQGEVLGVTHSFSSLARIAGPACGGILFSQISPSAPYICGGVVMFIAAYITVQNYKKLPQIQH